MTCIKNVKISIKFLSQNLLSHFSDTALRRNVKFSYSRNILVIKDRFTLIVFKQKNGKYHINITGIKSLEGIKPTITWLKSTYCNQNDFQLISHDIDNITSSFCMDSLLPLDKLATCIQNSSYNSEIFHALYIKSSEGTLVVFRSGKINIVGCKSVQRTLTLWNLVKNKINVVLMKPIL